jgi:cytochrome P450
MGLVTEMSLPTLPVDIPEFSADPDPYLDAARREHPWLARFSQGYVVHGYQAFKDLVSDDERLHQGLGGVVDFYGVGGTMWARFMEEMVLSQYGEAHTRLRNSVAAAFTPRHANQVRPLMQKVIGELLDEWAPKGAFDFADFASFFPVAVMCGLLGVSAEPIPRMRTALEDHMSSLNLDPSAKPRFMAAWDVLWDFADRTVREREQSGATDSDSLLDALIATKNAGELDETELRFMLLVLVIAGYDTSKNMLTVAMHLLLDRPDTYARCAEDKAFCSKAVEEALRHSGIANFFRVVLAEFEYDGIVFPQGTMLAFGTALAGRDPAAFPDPLTFDPERASTNRHVSFGRGAHICLGQYLARAQLEEGLHLIAQRLRNPRRTGEAAWKPFLGAWGLKTLPIAFDAGPARDATADQVAPAASA